MGETMDVASVHVFRDFGLADSDEARVLAAQAVFEAEIENFALDLLLVLRLQLQFANASARSQLNSSQIH